MKFLGLESRKKETEKKFKDAKQAKQKGKCLQFSIIVIIDFHHKVDEA
jgi:hypothetical protein